MFLDLKSSGFKDLKTKSTASVYPLQRLVDIPINVLRQSAMYCTLQRDLVKLNGELQLSQLYLKGQLQKLQSLEAENDRLKTLLNSSANNKDSLLIASILQVSSDPFSHKIVLNKGTADAVSEDQPIIDANGVMGATISTGKHSSRAILITDANYSIPVESLRNGIRAIAAGTGQITQLVLQHVPNGMDIKVGDLFITSGLGGKFPAGYPVGNVISVKNDISRPFALIKLKPRAKLDRTREVLLVKSVDSKNGEG